MDSITHIAVGACIGEVFAGKKIGKKAMWLGAAANSLPDIDFLFLPHLHKTYWRTVASLIPSFLICCFVYHLPGW
jgi:hypothetical protein